MSITEEELANRSNPQPTTYQLTIPLVLRPIRISAIRPPSPMHRSNQDIHLRGQHIELRLLLREDCLPKRHVHRHAVVLRNGHFLEAAEEEVEDSPLVRVGGKGVLVKLPEGVGAEVVYVDGEFHLVVVGGGGGGGGIGRGTVVV